MRNTARRTLEQEAREVLEEAVRHDWLNRHGRLKPHEDTAQPLLLPFVAAVPCPPEQRPGTRPGGFFRQPGFGYMALGFLLVVIMGIRGAWYAVQMFQERSLQTQVKALLYSNIRAAQDEDLDAYMNTLHPDAPQYAHTRMTMQDLIEMYTLDYELESFEILSESEQQIRVRVVETIRKVDGGPFRDHRLTAVHTLRRYHGEWRIYNSELVEQSEFLN